MIERLKTNIVKIGDKEIGGGNKILVQSMTNTDSLDFTKTINQIRKLEEIGVDLIRVSIPSKKAAENIPKLKERMRVPLIADIHNDYKLAILSIKNGADKIRINPGNIGGKDKLKKVVDAAKKKKIPIRIGINSGSIEKDILKDSKTKEEAIVSSAIRNINLFYKDFKYKNIVLSIKSSDIINNYLVHYELIKRLREEKLEIPPIHLGITEAGIGIDGVTKSAIGIGSLLLEGIGDTIRVSLTGDPIREVFSGFSILKSLGLLRGSINIISCPTCARTKVDLEKITNFFSQVFSAIERERRQSNKETIDFALMGCPVNGIGEAGSADIGFLFLEDSAKLFVKGKVFSEYKIEDIMKNEFITALVKKYDNEVKKSD